MVKNSKYYFFIIIFLFCSTKILADKNVNFLSLKNNKVNLRQGPSFEYPIKLIYKKKYLPVIILDSSETWRQIRDFENNSGWIHISQLSKKKSAINIKKDSILYKKSTIYSKPLAKLQVGRLVLVKKCKIKWCKISSGNYEGWILKNVLWGKIK
tara:strand:+ start:10967 stop:11428 length:462 start_codon:yes stop_codon:yes gene_type:complete